MQKEKIREWIFFFLPAANGFLEKGIFQGDCLVQKIYFSGFGLDKLIMHGKKQEGEDGILAKYRFY